VFIVNSISDSNAAHLAQRVLRLIPPGWMELLPALTINVVGERFDHIPQLADHCKGNIMWPDVQTLITAPIENGHPAEIYVRYNPTAPIENTDYFLSGDYLFMKDLLRAIASVIFQNPKTKLEQVFIVSNDAAAAGPMGLPKFQSLFFRCFLGPTLREEECEALQTLLHSGTGMLKERTLSISA